MRDPRSRAGKAAALMMGILAVATVLARFPLVFVLFSPLVLLVRGVPGLEGRHKARFFTLYATGLLPGAAFLAVMYAGLGLLGPYLKSVAGQIGSVVTGGEEHINDSLGVGGMLQKYVSDLLRMASYSVAAVLVLVGRPPFVGNGVASLGRSCWY